MSDRVWIVVGLLAAVLAAVAMMALLLLWRRARASGPDSTVQAARRAIRQSARDQRRRARGSIRGEGYGGDDNQGYNAGVTSDSGGMP